MTRTPGLPAAAAAIAAAGIALAGCTTYVTPKPASEAGRAGVVERFVDEPVPPTIQWTREPSPLGTLWHTYIPGVGVFTLDPTSHIVITAVFAQPSAQPRAALPPATLLRDARTFLTAHGIDLQGMALYRHSQHNDGTQTLFTATWRQRRGSAWLPALASVTLTASDIPVSFTHNPTVTAALDTTATITAAAARATVVHAAPGATTIGTPQLDVVGPPTTTARLVWVLTVAMAHGQALPTLLQVEVDAHSGQLVS